MAHGSIRIPDLEYKQRAQRAATLIKKAGLDVLIVNSNEADYANARYFSGFWPLFERCGVAIDESTITYNEAGKPKFVYLQDEICGFAFHLIQK